jgi:hypothetical protein
MDDETEVAIGERRFAVLKALNAALGLAKTRESVRDISSAVLASDTRDFCFHDLLLFDEPHCGNDVEPGWPFQNMLRDQRGVRMHLDLRPAATAQYGDGQPVQEAIVLVVGRAERSRPSGVLILGLSPHALERVAALALDEASGPLPQALEGLMYRYCAPEGDDPGGFRWVQIN